MSTTVEITGRVSTNNIEVTCTYRVGSILGVSKYTNTDRANDGCNDGETKCVVALSGATPTVWLDPDGSIYNKLTNAMDE